jgi:hypothetical protein
VAPSGGDEFGVFRLWSVRWSVLVLAEAELGRLVGRDQQRDRAQLLDIDLVLRRRLDALIDGQDLDVLEQGVTVAPPRSGRCRRGR